MQPLTRMIGVMFLATLLLGGGLFNLGDIISYIQNNATVEMEKAYNDLLLEAKQLRNINQEINQELHASYEKNIALENALTVKDDSIIKSSEIILLQQKEKLELEDQIKAKSETIADLETSLHDKKQQYHVVLSHNDSLNILAETQAMQITSLQHQNTILSETIQHASTLAWHIKVCTIIISVLIITIAVMLISRYRKTVYNLSITKDKMRKAA